MKRELTILCCMAFALSGAMMALTAISESPNSYKTASAATLSYVPQVPKLDLLNLPDDLVRDVATKKGIQDTVYITKTDTVPVTKVKVKKVPVPSNIMEINVTSRRDTIQVPVYYLATQVGNKEDPTGKCVTIYQVREVDKICPETINSSDNDSIVYHIDNND